MVPIVSILQPQIPLSSMAWSPPKKISNWTEEGPLFYALTRATSFCTRFRSFKLQLGSFSSCGKLVNRERERVGGIFETFDRWSFLIPTKFLVTSYRVRAGNEPTKDNHYNSNFKVWTNLQHEPRLTWYKGVGDLE